jgi:TolB-like protein/cytochrome c-type biogenesis protein CcmH/NrfG
MAAGSFLEELKRRNVIRMAGLYVVGAWIVVQVAGTLLPMFGAPAWLPRSIVILLAIGFPPVMLFSWIYELTPEGLKRDAEVPAGASIGSRTAQRMEHLLLVLLLLAVAYFVVDKFVLAPRRAAGVAPVAAASAAATAAPAPAASRNSIAVLPIENLSENKENGYFADGIQDQILTSLARIGDLKVISRTSTLKYASRPDNVSRIARELGVAHILEGSVQRAGNRVLITVQLIDAATDNHLWAETYDRTLEDVFGVQGEVAKKIAESLAATLSRGELNAISSRPTQVPAAFDAYLRARAYAAHVIQTRAQADRLLDAYREAVRLDPKFAIAWADLARELFRIGWVGLDPAGTLRAEGEQALRTAAQLAPGTPQVEEARAVHLYYVKRDFRAALEVIDGLKVRVPNDFEVWMWGGYLNRRVGRFAESLSDFDRARSLSPNDANVIYHLAVTAVSSGDCTRGLRELDASIAISNDNTHALAMKLQCAWAAGDLARASSFLAGADAADPAVQGLLGTQLLYRRDYAGAAAQLQRAMASAGDDALVDAFLNGYVPARNDWAINLAIARQRLGDERTAAQELRRVKADALRALAGRPDSPYVESAWRSVLGQALAGLGERAAAEEQARLLATLVTEEQDSLEGPGWTYYRARILAMNGDAAGSVPLLRHLVATRASQLSTRNLELDPAWDPIREDPAFKQLLASPPALER